MNNVDSCPGSVYIFNNQQFDDDPDNELFRHGSEKDVESLTKLFEEMGFGVECFINQTEAELDKSIDRIKKTSFEKIDSLIFFIMSHGTEKVIMTKDKKIKKLDDFIHPFNGKRSLNGKPKLFFIQSVTNLLTTCYLSTYFPQRSTPSPTIFEVEFLEKATYMKRIQKTLKIPIEADFFMVHSSIVHNLNDKDFGCWFIQNLCYVIRTHNQTEHLLTMITKINSQVERIPEKNIPTRVSSQLTKDIFFPKPIQV
jgi:hypothetical protein